MEWGFLVIDNANCFAKMLVNNYLKGQQILLRVGRVYCSLSKYFVCVRKLQGNCARCERLSHY